jgi:hypothetical protein
MAQPDEKTDENGADEALAEQIDTIRRQLHEALAACQDAPQVARAQVEAQTEALAADKLRQALVCFDTALRASQSHDWTLNTAWAARNTDEHLEALKKCEEANAERDACERRLVDADGLADAMAGVLSSRSLAEAADEALAALEKCNAERRAWDEWGEGTVEAYFSALENPDEQNHPAAVRLDEARTELNEARARALVTARQSYEEAKVRQTQALAAHAEVAEHDKAIKRLSTAAHALAALTRQ